MRIVIIVVIIIAAALGMSWVLGSTAEQGIRNFATSVSENPGYQAEVTGFDRGINHSVARLTIRPDLSTLMAGMDDADRASFSQMTGGLDQGINFIIDIYQGPVIMSSGVYPGLYRADITLDPESEIFRRYIPGNVDINEHFDATFTMGYFGQGKLETRVDAFLQAFGDTTLNFGGYDVDVTLGNYGRSYQLDSVIHPISLISAEQSLLVSAIELSGTGMLGNVIGDMDITAQIDSISGDGEGRVEIEDISLQMIVETTDTGTFTSSYTLSTGHIDSPDLPAPVNHLRMTAGVRDMSIAGATRFYDTYSQASNSSDPFAMQMAMMNGLADLFEGSPVFEISELSYSQGSDVTLDMQADLAFTDNVFANPAVTQGNPMAALGALKMNIDLAFSQAFMDMALASYVNRQFAGIEGMDPAFLEQMRQQQLAQMGAMGAQLVQAGYLVENAGGFTLQASMSDGQLLMNGNALPLPF